LTEARACGPPILFFPSKNRGVPHDSWKGKQDFADLCVAVVLLDGVVLHKAVTAKDFYGMARNAFGYLRSKVLAHGGFFQEAKPVVLEAGTVINHEPGGLDFGGHFGEVKLDRLKLPNCFAELLAFKSVAGSVRPGALG